MDFIKKNLMVFYLIACIAGIFMFHWFFIGEMMPVTECLSVDCMYSPPQAIIQQKTYLLYTAIIALFISFLLFLNFPKKIFKKISERLPYRKKKIQIFCYKLISWLKILERRDPEAALITAQVFVLQ
jgi:hypothetical protein